MCDECKEKDCGSECECLCHWEDGPPDEIDDIYRK